MYLSQKQNLKNQQKFKKKFKKTEKKRPLGGGRVRPSLTLLS
jgi:hypothetical protein